MPVVQPSTAQHSTVQEAMPRGRKRPGEEEEHCYDRIEPWMACMHAPSCPWSFLHLPA